jgi:hypothetical protein
VKLTGLSPKTERYARTLLGQAKRHADDFREITVGTSVPSHRVTPRIVSSAAVERFKRTMGVCMAHGCHKIAGHGGAHT